MNAANQTFCIRRGQAFAIIFLIAVIPMNYMEQMPMAPKIKTIANIVLKMAPLLSKAQWKKWQNYASPTWRRLTQI